MEIWEIDQRKLQKHGGLAARYPVSLLIFKLLKRAASSLKRERERLVCIDLTFGEGRFWVIPRQKRIVDLLVGVDVQLLSWKTRPDIFIQRPLQKVQPLLGRLGLKFDVLVVDPPFYEREFRGWETRPHYAQAWGKPRYLLEEGYRIAAALDIPFVIAHFNKNRFDTGIYKHIIEVRFTPIFKRSTAITSYYWLSSRH